MSHGSPTPGYVWKPARQWFRWHLKRQIDLRVEGFEYVPRDGAAMLVARHFHHYWDGAIFSATFERPIHIVVGLDWSQGIGRKAIEALCRAADFPIILRTGTDPSTPASAPGPAVDVTDARRYLRQAVDETTALLRAGELMIVFPEGYPTIDPHASRKPDRDAFLPFQPGFVQLVAQAQRGGTPPVPIIPVGFEYASLDPKDKRWRVVVRFGEPVFLAPGQDRAALLRDVESRVKALSGYLPDHGVATARRPNHS